MPEPVVELTGVSKMYGGLRPLRIRQLTVAAGEQVGLAGFDQTTAEVFVNLVTGSTLPESGVVRAFGRATADITDSDDWLKQVDRFGIVSERIVLLEQFTGAQNIAMSLTLELEPLPPESRARAEALAGAVGLGADMGRPVAELSAAARHRVRIARALAGQPAILLVEHPHAGLDEADVAPLASDLRRVAAARGLSIIVLAAEPRHATAFAPRVLSLNGATGELTEARAGWWRRWSRK